MKCASCGNNIEETFLKKPIGTYIKVKGKKKIICSECQKLSKEEIASKL
ncbi:MAG: hypothetical protein ABIA93_04505 [Candidatus Woesearchaeota archaeon]